ncbi:MAG TPA: threonine/serine dehydratase [Steroidobacteraceae bacterium]
MSDAQAPSIAEMRAAAERIAPHILQTATQRWHAVQLDARLGRQTELFLKLELFQRTGTFKLRAAMLNVLSLDAAGRQHGVTAVSAGNHAIAVACAAQRAGVSAKVVMLATANALRVAAAQSFDAEIIMAPDGRTAFATAQSICSTEGRAFIHPFDGRNVVLGTGGVGIELLDQVPQLEAVIVAIGGGGLMSGVAAAVKQMNPACLVYGVEPIGAAIMSRSFEAASAQSMDRIDTIADSLAPPLTTQATYELCKRFVDDIVTVSDDAICESLALLYQAAKLAVEPAGAAALAGVLGPLAARLAGKRIGVVVCGANIDSGSFYRYLQRGEALLT